MKLKKQRKYRDNLALTRGIISRNPVLYYGFALPFIIVTGTNLKNGIAFSLAMLFTLVPAMVVASLFGSQIPKYLRIIVYSLTSMAFLQLSATFIKYISPNIFDSMGIYFPLIVLNSMMANRTENYAVNQTPIKAMLDGLINTFGFTLVICAVSSVREIFGYGTIWGVAVDLPFKATGISLPFAGFIIVGFLVAFGKFLDRLIKKLIYKSENGVQAGGRHV